MNNMFLKYFLVILSYLIWNVYAYNFTFERCGYNGWTCSNSTDKKINITFSCSQDFEKKYPVVTLLFSGLPKTIQSVTIQNCDVSLTIGSQKINSTENILDDSPNYNLTYFRRFEIKNVTNLSVGPLFSGLQLIMWGNLSVSVENVRHMETLPSEMIIYPQPSEKMKLMNMDSMNFTLKDVSIDRIENRAIKWAASNRPLIVTWSNVNVTQTDEEALLTDIYNEDYPIRNITSYPNIYVNITNSTFQTLPTNFTVGIIRNFTFTNNFVNLVDNSAINITSAMINISKNEFNHLNNFSFACVSRGKNAVLNFDSNKINSSDKFAIYFGVYDAANITDNISFHGNEFSCLNSTWMQRDQEENITHVNITPNTEVNSEDIKTYEEILYQNNDNVCGDEILQCALPTEQFRQNYFRYNNLWDNYCVKKTSEAFFNTIRLILLITLIITCRAMYKKSTPELSDSHVYAAVPLSEAKWIERRDVLNETEIPINKFMKADNELIIFYEGIFYNNWDNICTDKNIQLINDVSVQPIKLFHECYTTYFKSWQKYCLKSPNDPPKTYIFIVLSSILALIIVVFCYAFKCKRIGFSNQNRYM